MTALPESVIAPREIITTKFGVELRRDAVNSSYESEDTRPEDKGAEIVDLADQREWHGWDKDEVDRYIEQRVDRWNEVDPKVKRVMMEAFLLSGLTVDEIEHELDMMLTKLRHNLQKSPADPNDPNYDPVSIKEFFQGSGIRQDDHSDGVLGLEALDEVSRWLIDPRVKSDDEGKTIVTRMENAEDIAWHLAYGQNPKDTSWGYGEVFSMFDARICRKADGSIDREKSGYFINEKNFYRWVINYSNIIIDVGGPNAVLDFNQKLAVYRAGNPHYGFEFLLENKESLYKSFRKEFTYNNLGLGVILKMFHLSQGYNMEAKMRALLRTNKMKEWREGMEKLFAEEPLVMTGFKNNAFLDLLTGGGPEGGLDPRLGPVATTITNAYFCLSDYEMLRQVMGADSAFFTLDAWTDATTEVAGVIKNRMRLEGKSGYVQAISDKDRDDLKRAFSADGKTVENPVLFIKVINQIFNAKNPPAFLPQIVRRVVSKSAAKTFGMLVDVPKGADGKPKKDSWQYKHNKGSEIFLTAYEQQAWYISGFLGGHARNDFGAGKDGISIVGDDFYIRYDRSGDYIDKLRAGLKAAGHETSAATIRSLMPIPALAIRTRTGMPTYDRNGNPIPDADNPGQVKTGSMSMLTVIEAMSAIGRRMLPEINNLNDQLNSGLIRKEDYDKRLAAFLNGAHLQYKNTAAQMAFFDERAIPRFGNIEFRAAGDLYDFLLSGAEALGLDMFAVHSPFGGAIFDKQKFYNEFQAKFSNLLVDLINKYDQVDFSQMERVALLDSDGVVRHYDMPLCLKMFSYDILDQPEFWQRDANGKPKTWNGIRLIDPKLVNENRKALMKYVLLDVVAKRWLAHQKASTGDKRFHPSFFHNAFKALEELPVEVDVDDLDRGNVRTRKKFLTGNYKKFFKERALMGLWGMKRGFGLKWWAGALFRGKKDKKNMISFMFGEFIKAITGY